MARGMFLNDKYRTGLPLFLPARFRGFGELTFTLIFLQAHEYDSLVHSM
jgi:hypothetical protein